MLSKLREYWDALKEGESGERFRAFYDYRNEHRESGASRFVSIGFGAVLVLGGAGIGWLPGPGGFVAILGLALLAKEFRPLAALLDWTERRIVALWRGFRSLSTPAQGGLVALALIATGGAGYLAYDVMLT